jgi:hypothetical protein
MKFSGDGERLVFKEVNLPPGPRIRAPVLFGDTVETAVCCAVSRYQSAGGDGERDKTESSDISEKVEPSRVFCGIVAGDSSSYAGDGGI